MEDDVGSPISTGPTRPPDESAGRRAELIPAVLCAGSELLLMGSTFGTVRRAPGPGTPSTSVSRTPQPMAIVTARRPTIWLQRAIFMPQPIQRAPAQPSGRLTSHQSGYHNPRERAATGDRPATADRRKGKAASPRKRLFATHSRERLRLSSVSLQSNEFLTVRAVANYCRDRSRFSTFWPPCRPGSPTLRHGSRSRRRSRHLTLISAGRAALFVFPPEFHSGA